ncbi:hypothetical protein QWY22_04430 [Planococcus liqunii]|uniref:hypothetical protein n=1 Tax=Planococcus liqunii TaxID=3058394 RepID=UPI002609E1AC|nr:hypothetical protein [Planococcus sp. N056]WKA51857.1 hypothetical protein QWY22_04430 [Planococcus sp. N056]
MEKYIVIQDIEAEPEWPKLFGTALSVCGSFQIMYPDGEWDKENPLLTGKSEFEKLEEIQNFPWSGMKDSTIYSGPLNAESRELFWHHMVPREDDYVYPLWNFNLYREGKLVFSIQDFSVCLAYSYPEMLEIFAEHGIDLLSLEG